MTGPSTPPPLWKKPDAAETPRDTAMHFAVGEDYRWDTLLLPYDIRATRVHAWGLAEIGMLTPAEFEAVAQALDALAEQDLAVRPEDEDSHTVIEHRLTEALGDVGKKIHAGRSRNDQVLAALRLYLRDALSDVMRQTADMARLLCRWGEEGDRWLMPGYTHMQRAMPSTVGLWAMGYAELFAADIERLRGAVGRINVSPLGSAAGYGVPGLALPRNEMARRLGFDGVQEHVTAVQLSRGKLELDVAHALAQIAGTCNRLASDLVLYHTAEFGFLKPADTYGTGSSIMPQKRNPDVPELVRASYHRILAEMQLLASLPANLPSGYHRDLQLTKEAVLRAVHATASMADAMIVTLRDMRFDPARLDEATSPDVFATAQALALAREGVPFREAYRRTAAELDTLQKPSAEEALTTYQVDGYPGQCRPDRVLERVEEALRRGGNAGEKGVSG